MSSIGFSHFVSLAPNYLALVAPDGRHWSRAELLQESQRSPGPAAREQTAVSANSAEYLAMLLAQEDKSPDRQAPVAPGDQATSRNAVRHPILPLDIKPGGENTVYIGASLNDPGACAWALGALAGGCPLIITQHWVLVHFLRAVNQYQVSGCYLSSLQMAEIAASPLVLSGQYNLSSLREFLVDGNIVPAPPNWAGTDKT